MDVRLRRLHPISDRSLTSQNATYQEQIYHLRHGADISNKQDSYGMRAPCLQAFAFPTYPRLTRPQPACAPIKPFVTIYYGDSLLCSLQCQFMYASSRRAAFARPLGIACGRITDTPYNDRLILEQAEC